MFKSKKKESLRDTVRRLTRELETLKDNNAELATDVNRLDRIIRYASDVPTYHYEKASRYMFDYSLGLSIEHKLYIYVNKREYIIELENLPHFSKVFEDSFDFSVSGDMAYFSVSCVHITGCVMRYNYTIDYEKGIYVTSVRDDVERTEAYKKEQED